MNWNNAETNPPDHMDEVLVSDGDGSYAVGYYSPKQQAWSAADDIVTADNYDGLCRIYLDCQVRWWAEIDPVK